MIPLIPVQVVVYEFMEESNDPRCVAFFHSQTKDLQPKTCNKLCGTTQVLGEMFQVEKAALRAANYSYDWNS